MKKEDCKIVYVLDVDGNPLMPTTRNGWVRRSLRDGKAVVVHTLPFTIQLTYITATNVVQDIVLGIDPGSKEAGFAARVVNTNEIVYTSILKLRTDIVAKLKKRKAYRNNRRARKTRYRKPRFDNRTRSEGWLPPSVQSKVDSTIKEVEFIRSILPIAKIIVEKCAFDIHKLTNPTVFGYKYQRGPQYNFENVKAYVLARDGYKCMACKGKNKDVYLQVHHIQYKSKGGTDAPKNLLTLCSTCHNKAHKSKLKLTKRQLQVNTIDATQVSIVSKRIIDYLVESNTKYRLTYGYETKIKRRILSLSKEHHLDAIAITYNNKVKAHMPWLHSLVYYKFCLSKGDYQQTKGVRSQQAIPTGKIIGIRKFDKVEYKGIQYLVKGRQSKGYAYLMDKYGVSVKIKPTPKLKLLTRVGARKTCMIMT